MSASKDVSQLEKACATYRLEGADATINVQVRGRPSPHTLVFLHFWGGSSRTWRKVIDHLGQNTRTIAIDLRGWGASSGPSDPMGYSIKAQAEDVKAVIDKLRAHGEDMSSYVLAGHSMGGKVAQLVAAGQPKGLKGLVLVAPAPPTPLRLPEKQREQQIHAYDNETNADMVVRNVLSSSPLSDETVGMIVQDCLKGKKLARMAWPAYGMAEDISAAVEHISVPVFIIAGELDRVETVDRVKQKVSQAYQGSSTIVLDRVGHLLPLEAPAKVASNIKGFLQSIQSSRID